MGQQLAPRLSSDSRSAAVPVTGHQRDMLSELATQLDEEDITETRHIESPIDKCDDCGKRHLPRRLVCCVDGTWMTPDGAEGTHILVVTSTTWLSKTRMF